MSSGMTFKVGFGTDIGMKRTQNQDSGGAYPDLGLFIVADGMGGHKGGETASTMVIENVPPLVRKAQENPEWDPKVVIRDSIVTASNAIYERAMKQPELEGMGTTAVAMLFKTGTLTVGHVGDSRCYFFRSGCLWQITRDHSLVQEKLRAGLITREELRTDQMKNILTRSVGFERNTIVETYEIAVREGDLFLLCSDGLSGLVDDIQMQQIVQRTFFEGGDLDKTVTDLIHAANSNGGDDNITTILVQVGSAYG